MNVDLNNDAPPFDLKNLEPKPNNWLETDLTYEGRGTEELASPKGTIAGPFVAHLDQHGSFLIETVYETLSPCDPDYRRERCYISLWGQAGTAR